MRLIQGGRIRDALAALFARKGIDDEMRWTDQPFVHSGGRLNGDELIHKGFVKAAPKLTERLRQHEVGLGGIDLILAEATGIHDGKVGTQALADILVGGPQLMLEQL